MRPFGEIMTAVVGFGDRNMINQCLMNRYVMSYEPFNFKGMPSDYPETIAYGAKMDALRTEMRNFFWDGEFCDKLGGKVTCTDGNELNSYSVFIGKDGKTGMVICNYNDEPVTVVPVFNQGTPKQYRFVDDKELVTFDKTLTIPGRSAAVVI